MRARPLGITVLAFTAIMVGLYCQIAAMALILGGTLFGVVGSDSAVTLILLGAAYLGLMAAAFMVGYGFWTLRHWSWVGGIIVFGSVIVASFMLVLMSANVDAVVVPSIGAAVAIWYLFRPATRASFPGAHADVEGGPEASAGAPESRPEPSPGVLETPQSAR
jgi:hypothetical protein